MYQFSVEKYLSSYLAVALCNWTYCEQDAVHFIYQFPHVLYLFLYYSVDQWSSDAKNKIQYAVLLKLLPPANEVAGT